MMSPISSTRVIVSPKSVNQKLTCVKARNDFGAITVLSVISNVFEFAGGTKDHPLISIDCYVGL